MDLNIENFIVMVWFCEIIFSKWKGIKMSKMVGKIDLKLVDKFENIRFMFGLNFKVSENL